MNGSSFRSKPESQNRFEKVMPIKRIYCSAGKMGCRSRSGIGSRTTMRVPCVCTYAPWIVTLKMRSRFRVPSMLLARHDS